MDCRRIKFWVSSDERGKLCPLEAESREVPFEIKRIYFIFDTLPDEVRGQHAHRDLEQVLIAIDGACTILVDDGTNRIKVPLNRPDEGLYVGKGLWREMLDFSYGCKLLVLASQHYNEDDYIRDYETFIKEKENNDS